MARRLTAMEAASAAQHGAAQAEGDDHQQPRARFRNRSYRRPRRQFSADRAATAAARSSAISTTAAAARTTASTRSAQRSQERRHRNVSRIEHVRLVRRGERRFRTACGHILRRKDLAERPLLRWSKCLSECSLIRCIAREARFRVREIAGRARAGRTQVQHRENTLNLTRREMGRVARKQHGPDQQEQQRPQHRCRPAHPGAGGLKCLCVARHVRLRRRSRKPAHPRLLRRTVPSTDHPLPKPAQHQSPATPFQVRRRRLSFLRELYKSDTWRAIGQVASRKGRK